MAPCHEDPASSKGLSRSCTLTRQSPRQSASVACSGIENCVHLNCGVWLPHPLSSNIHRDQKGHLHSKSKLICPFFPSPVPCSQIESGSSRLAMLSPAVNGEAGALHAELTDLDLHMHTQACQTRLSDMHDRSVQLCTSRAGAAGAAALARPRLPLPCTRQARERPPQSPAVISSSSCCSCPPSTALRLALEHTPPPSRVRFVLLSGRQAREVGPQITPCFHGHAKQRGNARFHAGSRSLSVPAARRRACSAHLDCHRSPHLISISGHAMV